MPKSMVSIAKPETDNDASILPIRQYLIKAISCGGCDADPSISGGSTVETTPS